MAFSSSISELAISLGFSFSTIDEIYLSACLLYRVPSSCHCILRYFVVLLARKTVPILFKSNALPFKCYATSMFRYSIGSRSFVLHMIFKYSLTALGFKFNVESFRHGNEVGCFTHHLSDNIILIRSLHIKAM